MKATKLMALGLVGLTTLGLASTAKAEEDNVNTEASVTFTIGKESGDQNGPDGKPVAPDNPVVETPTGVNGWKLSVPSKLLFTGKGEKTLLTNEETGVKRVIYNINSKQNDYEALPIYYADFETAPENEQTTPFFLRFDQMSDESPKGEFTVSVTRDAFKLNGVPLDVDSTSYIQFPIGDVQAQIIQPDGEDKLNKLPTPIQDAKFNENEIRQIKNIAAPGTTPINIVDLTLDPDLELATQGFITFDPENTILHLGSGSKTLSNVKSATVTTVLTWTFAAKQ